MSQYSFRIAAALAASLALSARPTWAHSDLLVANVAGKTAIGSAEDVDGPDQSFDLTSRVFESILRTGFAPPTPVDYESEEPGFYALHGVDDAADLASLGALPLPAGAAVSAALSSFTIGASTDSLFYWNGIGSVDFQPASVVQPGVTFVFSPPSFGVSGPQGSLDAHPIYQLNASAGVPADGVYLIAPQVSVAGLETSEPFYLVLLADALITGEDQLEAVEAALEALEAGAPDAVVDFGGGVTKDFAYYEPAVEWVGENLVIPEPASAALALLGIIGVSRLQRAGGRRK